MKIKLSLTSLRVRLLVLVLGALLPCILFLFWELAEQRTLVTGQARAEAQRNLESIAQQHAEVVEGIRQTLQLLAEMPQIQSGDSAACTRFLAGRQASSPHIALLAVAAPDGRVACSSAPVPPGTNLADRGYFRRVLESGDFSISAYQLERITGKPAINFAMPVRDAFGTPQAVAIAALNLAWLDHFTRSLKLPEGAELLLLDPQGVVLSDSRDDTLSGRPLPAPPLTAQLPQEPSGGILEANGTDGVMRLYAYMPLVARERAIGVLAVGLPTGMLYAPLERAHQLALLALALIGVVTFGLAWIGSQLFVLKPVRALLRAMHKVAAGDLDARSGVAPAPGEINQLAMAFDSMADVLARRERELLRHTEEIRLLQSLTVAVSTAENLDDALTTAMRMVCEATRWHFAQAWVPAPDGSRLELSNAWHAVEPALLRFRDYSKTFTFEPGIGLPGRAWKLREPAWIDDVSNDSNFPRAPMARELGLRAGMAVP
ncbi:MAG: HAMP domain-containing protein, partial [Rhodocyclaceae bacterium]|nr:HAMP domain-containing protein [Rhodocyclaceae bacterium]